MERRGMMCKGLGLAGVALGLITGFAACSNGFDIVDAVKTDVKAATNKFLVIGDVSPAANATEISPSSKIWIRFDRSLDMSTVSTNTIVFSPAASWTPDFDDATKTLTLTPAALNGGKNYTVTITREIRGADGSDLQAERVWKFTTSYEPYGSFEIQNWPDETGNIAGYTKKPQVKLIISPNDQVDKMHIWEEGGSDMGWQIPVGSVDWTLSAGDGEKTLWMAFKDSGTFVTSPTSHKITRDSTVPVITNFLVNSGGSYTTSGAASLTWTAAEANPYQMQFSNDGSSWSAWEPYAASKTWSLLAGDGDKTVYAQFTDKAGNPSDVVSDGIKVDATAPSVNIGTLQAMNIAQSMRTTSATATDATSGIASYKWAKDSGPGTVTFGADNALNTTVSADADGKYTLRLTVTDNAGNQASKTLDVYRDLVAPSITSLGTVPSLLNVAASSFTTNPTITEATSGIASYSWVKSAGTGSVSIANAAAAAATVSATADGTCTIQLSITDGAGNPASASTGSFSIDITVPSLPVFTVTPTSPGTVLPSYAWTSGGGGAGYYRYNFNSGAWSAETTATSYAAPSTFDFGSYFFYVQERDAGGNWSGSRSSSYFYYPDYLQPAYQAVRVSRTPVFQYAPTTLFKIVGTSWDLYVGFTSKSLVPIASGLTTYSYQLPYALPAYTTYYWQYVRHSTLLKGTYTSPIYKFATGP